MDFGDTEFTVWILSEFRRETVALHSESPFLQSVLIAMGDHHHYRYYHDAPPPLELLLHSNVRIFSSCRVRSFEILYSLSRLIKM